MRRTHGQRRYEPAVALDENVREGVSATGGGLLARSALPDADTKTLCRVL